MNALITVDKPYRYTSEWGSSYLASFGKLRELRDMFLFFFFYNLGRNTKEIGSS